MKTSETLFKIEHDRRLKLAKNQDAAGLLRLNMRELSESLWCAGWEADLEFTLWKDLDFWNGNHGGDGIHSHSLLYRPEAIKLRTLSRKAGGWWMWWKEPKGCKGVHSSGEVFVPMSEWKKIYAQHCASEGSKP